MKERIGVHNIPAHEHKPNILSLKAIQKIRMATVFAQTAHQQQSDQDDKQLDICQNRPNDRYDGLDVVAQLRPAGQPQLPGKVAPESCALDLQHGSTNSFRDLDAFGASPIHSKRCWSMLSLRCSQASRASWSASIVQQK